MKLVFNAKTDCKTNIKGRDAFYWVSRIMSDNGYEKVKMLALSKSVYLKKI